MQMTKTISKDFTDKIRAIAGAGNVKENEPMKLHTSMEVGGEAALYVTPESKAALADIVSLAKEAQVRYYIIGNASNVIVKDEGFAGLIISTEKLSDITADGKKVIAQSGAMLKDIAKVCADNSLSGFEFASGIPGSIGGAVCMNAGAYDGEMKDVILCVELIDKDGNFIRKKCSEMGFSYRHSICSSGEYVVTEAVLMLEDGDKAEIEAKIEELSARRKEKQPLEFPSCGSTFKRPEGHFAGKLITDANLKGVTCGGAQVSEKHAGFIINKGGATAADIIELIGIVKEKVRESSGVELECEVKIIE